MPREYRRLHAEWYELRSAEVDHRRELAYWQRKIRAAGEPVLELGSGTGRVLIPLLEHGVNIAGIDTSLDMMRRCRAACRARGLRPRLYRQSILDFSLPRRFGLVIFPSGGLGLFLDDRDIRAAFARVMVHLRPGGTFIFEYEPVPVRPPDQKRWTGGWVRGPGGVVVTWRRKTIYQRRTRVWQSMVVFDRFVNGRLEATELDERAGRYFRVSEAVGLARVAGFERVRATDWLTTRPPTKKSIVVTVECRKPLEA
jgi:SAM-dependent methyltransferase